MNLISVVIPAFNEEELLPQTLTTLRDCSWVEEVIAVNDGSVDGTGKIIDTLSDTPVHFNRNVGKGRALMEGIKRANHDIILCLDADLGSTVKHANKIIEPLLQYDFIDVVIGNVCVQRKQGMGMMRRRAQQVILKKTGHWLSAPLSGQRAFRRKWIPHLLDNDYIGYGVEVAMTVTLLKAGAVFVEVETEMNHRETGKTLAGFLHRGKQWAEMERTLRRQTR